MADLRPREVLMAGLCATGDQFVQINNNDKHIRNNNNDKHVHNNNNDKHNDVCKITIVITNNNKNVRNNNVPTSDPRGFYVGRR
jgi:hypothetical protein